MKLRVGAYCRVSTEQDDQLHSLHSQQAYFEEVIRAHPGWVFAGIYADEGVTGTSTKKRVAFLRMVDDCADGKLDLILTKEVSRFARNTVDALNYTRLLREYGTGVLFLNDGIDTRQGDGEFRLSIMASVAQEESRKTSERVKWGQRRSMERGVAFGHTYGFDIQKGALTVNRAEAEVVQLIFSLYLSGMGAGKIARELDARGIRPPRAERWSEAAILKMLRNERYTGDLLQKKSVTVDYLSHRRAVNCGQEETVFCPNHHPAIVEREAWEAVQAELARRRGTAGRRYSARHWCSGKVYCGQCGSAFVPRTTKGAGDCSYRIWCCRCRVRRGAAAPDGCNMRTVHENILLSCADTACRAAGLDMADIAAALERDAEKAGAQGLCLDGEAVSRMLGAAVESMAVERDGIRVFLRLLAVPCRVTCLISGRGNSCRADQLAWEWENQGTKPCAKTSNS